MNAKNKIRPLSRFDFHCETSLVGLTSFSTAFKKGTLIPDRGKTLSELAKKNLSNKKDARKGGGYES